MAFELFLIAFGVIALGWIFASSRSNTARQLWRPGHKGLLIGRYTIAALTIWVLITAGGIAAVLGFLGLFFAGLHIYFTRPDREVGLRAPGPIRWVAGLFGRIERLLVGGKRR